MQSYQKNIIISNLKIILIIYLKKIQNSFNYNGFFLLLHVVFDLLPLRVRYPFATLQRPTDLVLVALAFSFKTRFLLKILKSFVSLLVKKKNLNENF
jgi:hypothetical protein